MVVLVVDLVALHLAEGLEVSHLFVMFLGICAHQRWCCCCMSAFVPSGPRIAILVNGLGISQKCICGCVARVLDTGPSGCG